MQYILLYNFFIRQLYRWWEELEKMLFFTFKLVDQMVWRTVTGFLPLKDLIMITVMSAVVVNSGNPFSVLGCCATNALFAMCHRDAVSKRQIVWTVRYDELRCCFKAQFKMRIILDCESSKATLVKLEGKKDGVKINSERQMERERC